MKKRRIIMVLLTLVFLFAPMASYAAEQGTMAYDLRTAQGEDTQMWIHIMNTDLAEHQYSLLLAGLDETFQHYFVIEGTAGDSVTLAPSESTVVQLNITAPGNPQSSNYDFTIEYKRDDGEAAFLPAHITINKDYAVTLVSDVNQLESLNGSTFNVQVVVTNTGSKALENIGVTAELPYKWVVKSISPETFSLVPGENAAVHMEVTIPASQTTGNTKISITAGNDMTKSAEITIPVKVTAKANFALFFAGVVALVTLVTVIYFRKHGRR